MLKNITTDLISKCKKKEITLSEYVILDNQQIKVKGELKDDCYQDGNFIGTFIFKELKFEASNEYNFKKKEIQYHKVIDGVDVNYGNFIVTEIKDNDTNKIVQVVAMDYGLKTQIKYKSSLNYSSGNITLLNVWNECCTLSNLESGITSFTNSDFIVDSNQFENSDVLVRDVMIAISQMACGFVKVMNDNKAYVMLQEETTDIIDEYVELEDFLQKETKNRYKKVVILDEVEDPHNVGSIIRTAVCAGYDGIILPKRRSSLINATVEKSSAGATNYIDIITVNSIQNAITTLKDNDFWIIASVIDAEDNYFDIDYTDMNFAIIMGNEKSGISRTNVKNSDFRVKLPIETDFDSLNVANAASVIIYESVRQKIQKDNKKK